MQFSNDSSKKSFSWQRREQPAKEKQSAVSQSLSHVQGQTAVTKSSLSFDRRKMVASTSGMTCVFVNIACCSMQSGRLPASRLHERCE